MREPEQYWNPILETLPREKLAELQLKKFKSIFNWAYEHSKFYHKLYAEAGIEPGDIRTFEDIRKIPKVEKSMMRAIQGKEPYPYGDMLAMPLERVTIYHQASRYIRPIAGRTGSGGLKPGLACYTLRATGTMTASFCPSVTTSSSPSGAPTTGPRSWAVRWSLVVYSIPRPGY
jgi:hypothetical protein